MRARERRALGPQRPPLAALRLLSIVLAWALLGAYHWIPPEPRERTASIRVLDRGCIAPHDGRRSLVESTAPARPRGDASATGFVDPLAGLPSTHDLRVPSAFAVGLVEPLEIADARVFVGARLEIARGPPAARL